MVLHQYFDSALGIIFQKADCKLLLKGKRNFVLCLVLFEKILKSGSSVVHHHYIKL